MIGRFPWLWVVFVLASLLTVFAVGYMARVALDGERNHAFEQAQRLSDERIHVALWRLDAAMKTILTRESIRPHTAYLSFNQNQDTFDTTLMKCTVLVASPLLTERPDYVRMHFTFDPQGTLGSPQKPSGRLLTVANANFVPTPDLVSAAKRFDEFAASVDRASIDAVLPNEFGEAPTAPPPNEKLWTAGAEQIIEDDRWARNRSELNARAQQVSEASRQLEYRNDINPYNQANAIDFPIEGGLHTVWVRDQLLLARRVRVGSETWIEGCWLEWPALSVWLLNQVTDLVPGASLVRDETESKDGSRHLASMPARLLVPRSSEPAPTFGAVHGAIAVVGVALAFAILISGLSLHAAISLSDRRGTFVSAVTHEMRTPLTTFQLLTDLLTSGRSLPEEKRSKHLATLRAEAIRLGHLVENVLGFSRLERGRTPTATVVASLPELLSHGRERLDLRARQSGKVVRWTLPKEPEAATVRVDPGGLEQILLNLVDNSCKYAAGTEDPHIDITITLPADTDSETVRCDVRDAGPGIPAERRRHLFRPFGKSARDAAHSAPGIGLGLALSRRLARQMGGDLRYVAAASGCTFRLELRRA